MKRQVLAVVAILMMLPGLAGAASEGGVTLSPAFNEINLKPGDKQSSFTLQITNNFQSAQDYDLTIADFGVLDESGGVAFYGAGENINRKYGLSSWMRVEPAKVSLKPKETVKVQVTVQNTETLTTGGHYGAVLLHSAEPTDRSGGRVQLKQIASALIFTRKLGGEVYKLSLDKVEHNGRRFRLPTVVTLRFENKGNVHVYPRGTVTLTDPKGRVVKKGVINEGSGMVMPESFRQYPVNLKTVLASQLPGKYQLEVNYRYDEYQEGFQTYKTSFYYFPTIWLTIAASVLIGTLLGLSAWLWKIGNRPS